MSSYKTVTMLEFPTYDIDELGNIIYNYKSEQGWHLHRHPCTNECRKVIEEGIAYIMTLPRCERYEIPAGVIYIRCNKMVALNRYTMGKDDTLDFDCVKSTDWRQVKISDRLINYLGYECTDTTKR